jgi:hypothetical protein
MLSASLSISRNLGYFDAGKFGKVCSDQLHPSPKKLLTGLNIFSDLLAVDKYCIQ